MPIPPALDANAQALVGLLENMAAELLATVAAWKVTPYGISVREAFVTQSIADLQHGVPPRPAAANMLDDLSEADVINAGWVEWTRDSPWPTGKLVTKALDNLAFLRLWRQAGGTAKEPAATTTDASEVGVLTGDAIIEHASRSWSSADPLVVTPLSTVATGAGSMDVRLGPQFIVFQRTDIASLRTFDLTWDAREVQQRMEVGWGEHFVLHPNELVLASTLEYFSFPADLSANVVTRSSYGRMGLITATAVQIHPFFRGCLTLELLNLGVVPLELVPGERIAQLVFIKVEPPAKPSKKIDYSCPTGPEFSRPTKPGTDSAILERMITLAAERRQPRVQ